MSRSPLGAVGSRLRTLRSDRGMTAARLAELGGLSKGYISQIESERKQPHWSTLMRLLHVLDERLCSFLADRTVAGEGGAMIVLAGEGPDEWGRVPGADEEGYSWIVTPFPEADAGIEEEWGRRSEVLRVRLPARTSWTPDAISFAAPGILYGLEGKTLLERVGEDRDEFLLEQGGVLDFDARRPHRIRTITDLPSEFLLVLTPAGA